MGVNGLWKVVAPCGRRIDVDTLRGKVLAVDASIWLTQFIKAMRNKQDGRMIPNAHIIGALRRILKLLHSKIKPLFVFDGGVPVLKKRIAEARRQKIDHNARVLRRAAEKLLLNQLLEAQLKKQLPVDNGVDQGFVLPSDPKSLQKSKAVHKASRIPAGNDSSSTARTITIDDESSSHSQNSNLGMLEEGDDDDDDDDDDDPFHGAVVWSSGGNESSNINFNEAASKEIDLTGVGVEDNAALPLQHIEDIDEGIDAGEHADEIIAQLPVKRNGDLDLSSVHVLPERLQYEVIARLKDKRRQRESKRNEFIPLAGNPEKYSALQLNHFLKDVVMKKQLDSMESALAAKGGDGKKIASDAKRQYVLIDTREENVSKADALGLNKCSPHSVLSPSQDHIQKNDSGSCSRKRPFMDLFNPTGQLPPNTAPKYENNGSQATTLSFHRQDKLVINFSKEEASVLQLNQSNPMESDADKEANTNRALKAAMTTAASLTSWAALAVKRAVEKRRPQGNEIHMMDLDEGDGLTGEELKATPSVSSSSQAMNIVKCQEDSANIARKRMRQEMQKIVHSKSRKGVPYTESNSAPVLKEVLVDSAPASKDISVDEPLQPLSPRLVSSANSNPVSSLSFNECATNVTNSNLPLDISSANTRTPHPLPKGEDFTETSDTINIEERRIVRPTAIIAKRSKGTDDEGLPKTQQENAAGLHSKRLNPEIMDFKEGMNSPGHEVQINCADEVVVGEEEGVDLFSSSEEEEDDDYDALSKAKRCKNAKTVKIKMEFVDENEFVEDRSQQGNQEQIASQTFILPGELGEINRVPAVQSFERVPDSDERLRNDVVDVHNVEKASLDLTGVDVEDIDEEEEEGERDIEEEVMLLEKEASEINTTTGISEEELTERSKRIEEAQRDLIRQNAQLIRGRNQAQRDAETVTPLMLAEVKELLDAFGLPYVESPMEAEAQCAELEIRRLVDGVITDDCDAFLFGAQNVYKNIFDDRKYVEAYKATDIQRELGLDRTKLIHMALLLGSDYTIGIKGIGVVNASEIVSVFPTLDEFRDWVNDPSDGLGIERGKNQKKKRRQSKSRSQNSNVSTLEGCDDQASEEEEDAIDTGKAVENCQAIEAFKSSHRSIRKKWVVGNEFPSNQVIEAYQKPIVERQVDLEWGLPDRNEIRSFLANKLGWSPEETDNLITKPLDEYTSKAMQTTLDSFIVSYKDGSRFAAIRSKRMQKAVKDLQKQKGAGGRSVKFVNSIGLEVNESGAVVPRKKGKKKTE